MTPDRRVAFPVASSMSMMTECSSTEPLAACILIGMLFMKSADDHFLFDADY